MYALNLKGATNGLLSLVFWSLTSLRLEAQSASEQKSAPPPPPVPHSQTSEDSVRISMEKKGFSIVPPSGWQIEKETPGVSLLMRSAKESFPGYFPTLQVTVSEEEKFIDELTVSDFTSKMTAKITNSNSNIHDFRFLDHSFIELEDGRPAILFYAEFKLADMNFMQAMLLASSKDKHYILTFTDSSENFDGQPKETFFNNAWISMMSLTLDTPTPTRSQFFWKFAVPLGLILGCFIILRQAYRIRSGRKYGKMLLDMDVFGDQLEHSVASETNLSKKMRDKKQRRNAPPAPPQRNQNKSNYIEVSTHADSLYPESVYASLLDPSEHESMSTSDISSEHNDDTEKLGQKTSLKNESFYPANDKEPAFSQNITEDDDIYRESFYDDTKKAG